MVCIGRALRTSNRMLKSSNEKSILSWSQQEAGAGGKQGGGRRATEEEERKENMRLGRETQSEKEEIQRNKGRNRVASNTMLEVGKGGQK